jgi:methionyl-tRNA formyltransferase
MKLVFMGTPAFAAPSLQALYDAGYDIAGVFTQPDRPSGRGGKITGSPVKALAENLKLTVFQPVSIKDKASLATIRMLEPECIVVVAYGQILPQEILEYPAYGCVNVHASLLPAYRGAAPIHWAVINGETRTGVTTMRMDQGLDTGDILLTREIPISPNATTGEIHDELMILGAEVLLQTLASLREGTLAAVPQTGDSSYAPLLQREHEKLEWSLPAKTIHDRIRGLSPWPGAFTTFRGEQIKIWRSELISEGEFSEALPKLLPGEIMLGKGEGLMAGTGQGGLKIIELQPAGKKRMSAFAFYNGRQIRNGEFFI